MKRSHRSNVSLRSTVAPTSIVNALWPAASVATRSLGSRMPDVIAFQPAYTQIRRRGFGETVDIAGEMKTILISTIKDATQNYKINYLALSKAKAMRDLLIFRSKDLKNQADNFFSSVQASNPPAYSFIQTFKLNFVTNWQAAGIGIPMSATTLAIGNALKNSSTVVDITAKIKESGLGLGLDERYTVILPYKEQLGDFFIAASNLQAELDKAQAEVSVRSNNLPKYEAALKAALDDGQKYIPGLPTISQIQERLDKGLDPLPELAPPPPPVVQAAQLAPDVIAIPEVVEPKKSSIVPLVAGAAAIALAFLGKK